MKNKIRILLSGLSIFLMTSCADNLELTPISSISDANFWRTPDQFDAFVSGLHAQFRANNGAFQSLGEMRADIFGTDPPSASAFTGEATQGLERMWQNSLDLDNSGVSNFGGFYYNIDQINLLISKLNTTSVVASVDKNYYLGIAYGMRAFYYFQLVRSWGGVVIQTDPVTSVNVSGLSKAASPVADVLTLIKSDIDNSVTSFATDYTFRNSKSFWSKSATLMLKAEVYLWTSYRGGGVADAGLAQAALADIQANAAGLALLPNFADVFSSTNRGNNEIIFASRYKYQEANMNFVSSSFVPQSGLIANFYDSVGNRKFTSTVDNWGGLLRAPVTIATFRKFKDSDSRKWASIQPAYTYPAGTYVIAGCFTNKFQGEQQSGVRQYTNDYPIYRYADLLLLLAEAKIAQSQDPSNEINLVRARAFGTAYSSTVQGYPNQAIDANPQEAILQERLFEFVFEGKRWYDLRRMGDSFVYAHTSVLSSDSYKLLWPIDRTALTNNRGLAQNPGYAGF
ncbi:MAG: SusD family outer membrane lipoprotein NanU [Bacteroidetes bacterium]|nr:SusD family outer membrane lipoprotein NanU [Bacteroidota bacterium]